MIDNRANLLLARLGAIVAVALAAGCAELPSVVVPTEVKVEVPIACVPPGGVPQRPATTPETDLMAQDTYRRTLTAWRDLMRLQAYSAELEAVLEGCRRLPSATPP